MEEEEEDQLDTKFIQLWKKKKKKINQILSQVINCFCNMQRCVCVIDSENTTTSVVGSFDQLDTK